MEAEKRDPGNEVGENHGSSKNVFANLTHLTQEKLAGIRYYHSKINTSALGQMKNQNTNIMRKKENSFCHSVNHIANL